MMSALGILRHLIAVLALPFVMTVVIPVWISERNQIDLAKSFSLSGVVGQTAGFCLLLIGLSLFFHSLRRFATEGEGTLAPWDPPQKLVIRGPYRFVRNPMISGVVLILVGEALMLQSGPHALWAATFFGINAVYIPLLEEPRLKHRFGADYIEYCEHVPRLVPRLRPWQPASLRPIS